MTLEIKFPISEAGKQMLELKAEQAEELKQSQSSKRKNKPVKDSK